MSGVGHNAESDAPACECFMWPSAAEVEAAHPEALDDVDGDLDEQEAIAAFWAAKTGVTSPVGGDQ